VGSRFVNVRVLYTEDCPNLELTLDRVRSVFAPHVGTMHVETIQVETIADAIRHRFFGSPTVQVNGVDVDPTVSARGEITLGCRLYDGSGSPSVEMLEAAVPVATS
jgi:hypothetical protein